jgi:hypothetical protein
MRGETFDPQRWDHWLVIIAFTLLSSWIIWQVYFDR